MRSFVLTAIGKMELQQAEKPKIAGDFDVLLKVASVGVCGSDLHYYREGRIGDQVIRFPFRMGHECSAIVTDVGGKVSTVKQGDHVAVEPAVSCGSCSQCRSGRKHTCLNLRFLGAPDQISGCLADFIVMPEENCYPVSKSIHLSHAAFAEPLSIGIYAAQLLNNPKAKKIALLGVGPIGLSVLMALRKQQHCSIFVTDKIDSRLDLAISCGAVNAVNRNQEDTLHKIMQKESEGFDAVFECCGEQDALDDAIKLLKPGGKLLMVGIPTTDRISFDINDFRRKEINVQNVRRQNNCMPAAVKMVEEAPDLIDALITHQYALEETQKAMDLVATYADNVLKAVIKVS